MCSRQSGLGRIAAIALLKDFLPSCRAGPCHLQAAFLSTRIQIDLSRYVYSSMGCGVSFTRDDFTSKQWNKYGKLESFHLLSEGSMRNIEISPKFNAVVLWG